MATAEAMACGCAAVVTPTGFGGTLVHETEALICPFRAPEALAGAVRQLLQDEKARERISRAGRARVEGLTWERQVKELEMLYRSWLANFALRKQSR